MATGTFTFYLAGRKKLVDGTTDLDTNTIKLALTTSSYSVAADTHDFFDDVTNEVTGTGYTAGGATLGSKTLTNTVANSWSPTWAATTAYKVGDLVRPTAGNGYLYRCAVAGTSDGSQPTWPTAVGVSVVDATVTWSTWGTNVCVFDSADVSWTSSTIANARYGILYKSTGTASTDALIGYLDFGANVSSSDGTLQVTVHAAGWFYL